MGLSHFLSKVGVLSSYVPGTVELRTMELFLKVHSISILRRMIHMNYLSVFQCSLKRFIRSVLLCRDYTFAMFVINSVEILTLELIAFSVLIFNSHNFVILGLLPHGGLCFLISLLKVIVFHLLFSLGVRA